MKRILIGVLILVVAVGGGLAYMFMSKGAGHTTSTGSGNLTFAKVEPMTMPPVGGYQLTSVDLGDGPVPLITIPLDTWGGYAALFAANGGIKPNKDSLFYKKGHFAVQLVNEESATEQLKGYAAGRWPIIWAPMDSVPLIHDALKVDKRVDPKVLGLFDWSAGDGILVKDSIKNAADLKGKTILTSSNTPYSFMLLWYLAQNGMTGKDVNVVWNPDGDKALEIFKNNPSVVAWVSWTPYIYDVVDSNSSSYVPGSRLLISSKDANQLIADVYIVRSDLLADKPEMMNVFVEAMMEGASLIGTQTYNDMATFYSLKSAGEAKAMLDDVHIANFPENKMFFDENNAIGCNKIFILAQEYYKLLGSLSDNTSYEPSRSLYTKSFAMIDKKGLFTAQKNTMIDSFNRKAAFDIGDLENQRVVLEQNVQLYFEAQRLDFDPKSQSPEIQANMVMLGKIAEQTKFLATTVVKLVGYLDTAKVEQFKSQGSQAFIEASAQAKLISKKRAEYVKSLLVKIYGIDPSRIVTEGGGWDNPISTTDPDKNRRVEVNFISFE